MRKKERVKVIYRTKTHGVRVRLKEIREKEREGMEKERDSNMKIRGDK